MSAPAEEPKPEGEGEQKPKGGGLGGKLPLVFALVNTVGLMGLGAFVVLSKGHEDPKADKAGKGHAAAVASAASHEAGGEGHEAGAEEGAAEGEGHGEGKEGGGHAATLIVSMGTFVVNLKDPGGTHYLKCKIGMEVEGEGEVKKEAEGLVSKARYEVNMILSDLRVVDVTGPEKIDALRKVMLQKSKKALSPKVKVVGIWPEEWVIQ